MSIAARWAVIGVYLDTNLLLVQFVPWTQGCGGQELVRQSSKTCGTRQPARVSGGEHGDSVPGEFPWTCLLLNQVSRD